MKIKYQFNDEVAEIEVSDEWGEILIDLDRQEYNVNHKEIRRHVPLYIHDEENDEDFDSTCLIDPDADVVADVLCNMDTEQLRHAIQALLPQQQQLIYQVYFQGQSYAEIAREEGVDRSAVRKRMERILAQLKKVLE